VFHATPVASGDLGDAAWVDTEFGWDHFVLDTLGSKLMYGLTQAIGQGWGSEVTSEKVQELKEQWGALFPEFLDDDDLWVHAAEGYVDHQSAVSVSPGFVDKLRDPRVVVHGGNDNGGYPDIDYHYNRETGEYVEHDHTLPEGATREWVST
jgi:hypothetical protein